MSLLKINAAKGLGSPMSQLVSSLTTEFNTRGSEFTNRDLTQGVMSLEDLGEGQRESLNQAAQSIAETITGCFEDLHEAGALSFEGLSDTQKEAGTIAALAGADPAAYAQMALTSRPNVRDGVDVIGFESMGPAGTLDYRDEVSMETFDQGEIAKTIPYSISFNVEASRQDEFSEAFYPTTVVSPDAGGLEISVDRVTVHNAVKHKLSGKPSDFGQRNLVEAVSDASILADESTSLVPFAAADGSNADAFVSTSDVPAKFQMVGGVSVRTAPLKVGATHNLLGLSSHPELLGSGVMDHTDAIDGRLTLEAVYVKTKTNGEVIRFETLRLPRASFVKSREGSDREMDLVFRNDAVLAHAGTQAVDGSLPTDLEPLRTAEYRVRLGMSVNGNVNLEYGNLQIGAMGIDVPSITDKNGVEIDPNQGGGKAVADIFRNAEIVGYDLKAARTNSNRRTRGLLINAVAEREVFAIPLGAPISAPSPVGSDRSTRDLESLIQAARIRNSNNAVTTLLNYADTLHSHVINRRTMQGVPHIEGTGRHVVVPFYEEVNLDLKATINSLTSKERAGDISAVLINAIRDVAYRMYRDSGYQAALNAASVGESKPTLLVGTDALISRHMMVEGDNRTFGEVFKKHKLVQSFDTRMDNKIVLSFSRDLANGQPDPLSFGTHAWVPELAGVVQMNRDGATYKEAMVQPRSRHINNLPIMAVINVSGLKDVLTEKVLVGVEDTNGTFHSEEPATAG